MRWRSTDTRLVIGRVLPERKRFEHQGLRLFHKNQEAGVDICLLVGVIDNQIVARIIGDVGEQSNVAVKNMVSQATHMMLNAHAFITGECLEADIVGVVKEHHDRADGSFGFHYFDAHDVIQARTSRLTDKQICDLCQDDSGVHVRRALNDLRMALMEQDDTPFYCYRALETIRHDIGRIFGVTTRSEQWRRMRSVLSVTEEVLRVAEELALALRHGEPVNWCGKQWREIVMTTWDVVEAYMLFLIERKASAAGP